MQQPVPLGRRHHLHLGGGAVRRGQPLGQRGQIVVNEPLDPIGVEQLGGVLHRQVHGAAGRLVHHQVEVEVGGSGAGLQRLGGDLAEGRAGRGGLRRLQL